MAFFLAVVKKTKGASPAKCTFAANSEREALAEMAKIFNVSTTMELDEYDLMEIMTGGVYKPVASKINNETFAYRSHLRDNSKIETVTPTTLPVTTEKKYTPYRLAKA